MSLISAKQLDLFSDHLTFGGTNSRQLRIKQDADLILGSGGSLTMDSGSVITINYTPSASSDAVNKGYVDGIAQGLDIKESVRAVSMSNITLEDEQTIDGVALVAGDRVLVNGQTDAEDNGIYVVVDAGAWTRATDADSDVKVDAGMFCFVTEGSSYADTGWVLTTNDDIILGTTELSFTQFSSAGVVVGGAGIVKSGNTLAVELATNSALEFDAVGDGGKLQVASSIAGDGLAFSTGVISLDLNELTGAVIDVSADSFGFVDATDNSSKKESIADLMTAVAGDGLSATSGVLAVNVANGIEISGDNVQLASSVAGDGLAFSTGVISLDLNELTGAVIDVSADSFGFIDATDNSSKKESIADLMTAVAGDGLSATSGVLAVNVDDSSIEINADALRLKDAGITPAKLGFTVKREAFESDVDFAYSSPISTVTVSATPLTAAQLVEMQELYRNGVADGVKVAVTPAAAGEWRLNGTTLEIYGDITSDGDMYKVLFHS